MAQGTLKYEYEREASKSGMTSLGGLPLYMDLAESSGLLKLIDKNLKICIGKQGWTDMEILFSLIMLNLVGGDCVRDIEFACGHKKSTIDTKLRPLQKSFFSQNFTKNTIVNIPKFKKIFILII